MQLSDFRKDMHTGSQATLVGLSEPMWSIGVDYISSFLLPWVAIFALRFGRDAGQRAAGDVTVSMQASETVSPLPGNILVKLPLAIVSYDLICFLLTLLLLLRSAVLVSMETAT